MTGDRPERPAAMSADFHYIRTPSIKLRFDSFGQEKCAGITRTPRGHQGRTEYFSNILADRCNGVDRKFFGWVLFIYSIYFRSAFQPQSAFPAVAELLIHPVTYDPDHRTPSKKCQDEPVQIPRQRSFMLYLITKNGMQKHCELLVDRTYQLFSLVRFTNANNTFAFHLTA